MLMVGALLIALTIGYLIILHNMRVSEQPVERMFGASDSDARRPRFISSPSASTPPTRGMQVRAYLSPNLLRTAKTLAPAPIAT